MVCAKLRAKWGGNTTDRICRKPLAPLLCRDEERVIKLKIFSNIVTKLTMMRGDKIVGVGVGAVCFVALLFLLPSSAQSIAQPKDGVWVEAEGVFIMGDASTIELAKRGSLEAARRQAIEKALGVFVSGQTMVRNFQLVEDLIHVISRGRVVEEQVMEQGLQSSGGQDSAGIYKTRLKAKVVRLTSEHQPDFTVRSNLSRATYAHGEQAQIRLHVTQDAYVYVFNVTEDDHITMLIPNRFMGEQFLPADREYVFPPEALVAKGIQLSTFVPTGKQRSRERIKVIASRHPISALGHQASEAIFQEYRASDTSLLINLARTLATLDPSEWAEHTSTYEVVLK